MCPPALPLRGTESWQQPSDSSPEPPAGNAALWTPWFQHCGSGETIWPPALCDNKRAPFRTAKSVVTGYCSNRKVTQAQRNDQRVSFLFFFFPCALFTDPLFPSPSLTDILNLLLLFFVIYLLSEGVGERESLLHFWGHFLPLPPLRCSFLSYSLVLVHCHSLFPQYVPSDRQCWLGVRPKLFGERGKKHLICSFTKDPCTLLEVKANLNKNKERKSGKCLRSRVVFNVALPRVCQALWRWSRREQWTCAKGESLWMSASRLEPLVPKVLLFMSWYPTGRGPSSTIIPCNRWHPPKPNVSLKEDGWW